MYMHGVYTFTKRNMLHTFLHYFCKFLCGWHQYHFRYKEGYLQKLKGIHSVIIVDLHKENQRHWGGQIGHFWEVEAKFSPTLSWTWNLYIETRCQLISSLCGAFHSAEMENKCQKTFLRARLTIEKICFFAVEFSL